MYKALILDLNGVLILGPKLTDRLRDDFGVPEEESLPVLQEIMGKVRLPGAEDVFFYWKPYFEKWHIVFSRDEFLQYWFREEHAVKEVVDTVRDLKKRGLKIFILSQNFRERTTYYHAYFPFLGEIADKIYYSWQTGFKKNNPEAYNMVLTDNNLKPEECIFFDDSEKNIEVARGLGIESHLFGGVEDAKAKLGLSF